MGVTDPNWQVPPPAPTDAPAPAPTPTAQAPAVDPAPAPAAAAAPTGPPDIAPPPPAAAEPPPPGVDLAGELAKLQQQLAALEARTSSGQLTLAETDQALAAKVEQLRTDFEAWPVKGGTGQPQPWDLQAHGIPQPGVTRDFLPGGAADELSPVVVAHSKPILQPGTAGTSVVELGQLLATIGYPNSISKGVNHAFSFDDTIMAAVDAFKRDFHVSEDPSQFPGVQVETTVGPWLWEALLRAAKLALAG